MNKKEIEKIQNNKKRNFLYAKNPKIFEQIYRTLYKEFGKQGWWPIQGKYHSKKHDPFEVILGAILTQNTSWKNVEKAINNLNKINLINIKKLNKIKKSKLASLIKSAGYYNQKAERLKIISDYLLKNYNGNLDDFFNKDISRLRKELLSIKGIGPETADSIILYAAKKPVFVIDAYTKRIFSRIGICKNNILYEELQNIFHKNLPNKTTIFNEYHALIVELAKQYCVKKPKCKDCPIADYCKKFI